MLIIESEVMSIKALWSARDLRSAWRARVGRGVNESIGMASRSVRALSGLSLMTVSILSSCDSIVEREPQLAAMERRSRSMTGWRRWWCGVMLGGEENDYSVVRSCQKATAAAAATLRESTECDIGMRAT